MTGYHQPSGLTQGLALLLDAHWSPEQALAVLELLNDLRDRIAAHYQYAIAQAMQAQRRTDPDPPTRDPPF